MDFTKEKEYIFDLKLFKWVGLNNILNPNKTKLFGFNVYHICIVITGLYLLIVTLWNLISLYELVNDPTVFTFHAGVIINFLLSFSKIVTMVYYSKDIWESLNITNCNFLSYYLYYSKNAFTRWRRHSILLLYICNMIFIVVFTVWNSSPLVLKGAIFTIKRIDGSISRQRMNVYNLFPMISDDVYNNNFNTFIILEMILCSTFLYTALLFDNIIIMMSIAFSSHLETINDGITALNHEYPQDDANVIDEVKLQKKRDIWDDLKQIIIDHENVIISLNNYFNIIRPALYLQIFVASSTHIVVWFVAALTFYTESDIGHSILSIKLFAVQPLFTAQLYMTCNLFGTINEKKDDIIFALYCSNWTTMELKCKKLILFIMNMNNAVKPKLKYTSIKILNMEMFTSTLRVCYSLFSMLVNYNKNKKN